MNATNDEQNNYRYFVSFEDGPKRGLLLGPFTTEKACKVWSEFKEDNPDSHLSEVISACCDIDPKAHFFGYGMARVNDFKYCEYIPILNRIDPDRWNKVLS